MHDLAAFFSERIAEGLRRKRATTASMWAETFRVTGKPIPGPWRFTYHPWLRAMHDSTNELNVGQKSAQMGYTETVLNLTFFNIDVKQVDCLYVLPNSKPDAHDFSAARFDPALELSPHLSKVFSDVKNVGHKRAGSANLYIRGSRGRSGLKSVPVGFLVLDEVDEMMKENIPLATERQSGQFDKQTWMISTPTIEDKGINVYFKESSENHYQFKCPHCSRFTELIYPDCLIITAERLNDPRISETHLVCKECKVKLEHKDKRHFLQNGLWVPSKEVYKGEGWYINQMYSSTVSPVELGESVLKAEVDRGHEQELFNSKLGLPHVPDGSQLTDKMMDDCISDYIQGSSPHLGHLKTMGCDIGLTRMHFWIDQWFLPPPGSVPGNDLNIVSQARLLLAGTVHTFAQLSDLMTLWGIDFAVLDSQPERRAGLEFCNKHWGRAKLCQYPNGISGKSIHVHKEQELLVSVDRTSWLDLSLGRVRRGKPYMFLPKDIPHDAREHLKALVRIIKFDDQGNPFAIYTKKDSVDDHYAHARNYSEIALQLAAEIGHGRNIKSPM